MMEDWMNLLIDNEPIKEITFDIYYNPPPSADATIILPDDHSIDMDIVFEQGRLITLNLENGNKYTGTVVGVEGNTVDLLLNNARKE